MQQVRCIGQRHSLASLQTLFLPTCWAEWRIQQGGGCAHGHSRTLLLRDGECGVSSEDDSSHSGDEESVTGDVRDPLLELEVIADVVPPREAVIRAAIRPRDEVDPRALFAQSAAVMKSVPRFLRGPFRNALKLALHEATKTSWSGDGSCS